MKLKEIQFTKPVKVFQLFKLINCYTKNQKSFEDRRDDLIWEKQLSISGYVSDGSLYLNEGITTNPDLKSCNLITIEDHKIINLPRYPKEYTQHNRCLNLHHKAVIDDFEIWKKEELELHIGASGMLEIPSRIAYKIADIKQHSPIEVKYNHKTDSTFVGAERKYFDKRFIIEFLGSFESCFLLPSPTTAVEKTLPKSTKLIDLIKPLW